MSKRPVFKPNPEGKVLVETLNIEFTWFPGFSKSQKQKSIRSLHEEAIKTTDLNNILEISTKSEELLGRKASAFNLSMTVENVFGTVECFYQGSKVFENGGPYKDLYKKRSIEAKQDERLKTSGCLNYFDFGNKRWELNDQFYTWLYIIALNQNEELKRGLIEYDAFTDIEFNPKKSFNCQAHSAALFVSATEKGIALDGVEDPIEFERIFSRKNIEYYQESLF